MITNPSCCGEEKALTKVANCDRQQTGRFRRLTAVFSFSLLFFCFFFFLPACWMRVSGTYCRYLHHYASARFSFPRLADDWLPRTCSRTTDRCVSVCVCDACKAMLIPESIHPSQHSTLHTPHTHTTKRNFGGRNVVLQPSLLAVARPITLNRCGHHSITTCTIVSIPSILPTYSSRYVLQ